MFESLFYFVCPSCPPPHAWMRSECIPSSSINLLHSQNSHHVHSQQHPECRVLLFALFLNSQLCELVGQGWREEGSCSRHTWQLRESSEESDLVHRSSFDTVNCKFSSGEFPNVRDEVAPAFWQIKSCRITSSIWLFFLSAFWLSLFCSRSVSFSIWPQETRSSIWTISLIKVHCKVCQKLEHLSCL